MTFLLVGRWAFEYRVNRRVVVVWNATARRVLTALGLLVLLAVWVYMLGWRREDDFGGSGVGWLWRWFEP